MAYWFRFFKVFWKHLLRVLRFTARIRSMDKALNQHTNTCGRWNHEKIFVAYLVRLLRCCGWMKVGQDRKYHLHLNVFAVRWWRVGKHKYITYSKTDYSNYFPVKEPRIVLFSNHYQFAGIISTSKGKSDRNLPTVPRYTAIDTPYCFVNGVHCGGSFPAC